MEVWLTWLDLLGLRYGQDGSARTLPVRGSSIGRTPDFGSGCLEVRALPPELLYPWVYSYAARGEIGPVASVFDVEGVAKRLV
jgi:hypothetical protein